MATFANAGFNTILYAAARPTYPRQLFDLIFRFHEFGSSVVSGSNTGINESGRAKYNVAIDLGCGTGQATVELHPFKRVVGIDPSNKMVQGARQYVSDVFGSVSSSTATLAKDHSTGQIEFLQSSAENLSFLEDGSVDLVTSAQAAHWFDWQKLWPELARIVRKDGTVAFWGYSEMRFSCYPSLTPLIHAYSKGNDPQTSLGPFWEQPGRDIIDNHLQDIPNPLSDLFTVERVYFTGDHHPLPSPRPVILRKKMTWENFENYLRSFSSLHTYQAQNPNDVKRQDGDIVKRFLDKVKDGMRDVDNISGAKREPGAEVALVADLSGEVEVEWPLALVLAKRI